MRDCRVMVNRAGDYVATMGFNESCGLWQIVIEQRKEFEFSVLRTSTSTFMRRATIVASVEATRSSAPICTFRKASRI